MNSFKGFQVLYNFWKMCKETFDKPNSGHFSFGPHKNSMCITSPIYWMKLKQILSHALKNILFLTYQERKEEYH